MDENKSKRKRKRPTSPDRERRIREFMNRLKEDSLPEPTDEDRINNDKSRLRDHVGIGKKRDPRRVVLFFIELSPPSAGRGAACQHVTCKDRIKEDSYRIVVDPGMKNMYKGPDFYHVRCFEDLVDFSQAEYLALVNPVTRRTARMRGLKGTSIADGKYLLDGGAERLVLEWKVAMETLIQKRDELPIEPLDPDFNDLLHKSGSASYRSKSIDGMSHHEFFYLSVDLAPIESDGIEDQEEWNLFEQYLSINVDDVEDLNKPHSLSDMLSMWETDRFLACTNEENLTEEGKEKKEKLGKKAIRAIERLSSIPMPDFQSAFLRQF